MRVLSSREASARAQLAALPGVSRETTDLLERYGQELMLWQARINLVSPASVPELWLRHFLDSAQLFSLAPDARRWCDLGSGGGLPGMVLACILRDKPGGQIHLVESNNKKAAFLRHLAVTLDVPAVVHADRIEQVVSRLGPVDVVTARALASLDALLGYTRSLLISGTIGLFPKGRDVEAELTEARQCWHFKSTLFESCTSSDARIVEIRELRPNQR
jgi:16S rRNA (guanine527-N7)-methyltransferase